MSKLGEIFSYITKGTISIFKNSILMYIQAFNVARSLFRFGVFHTQGSRLDRNLSVVQFVPFLRLRIKLRANCLMYYTLDKENKGANFQNSISNSKPLMWLDLSSYLMFSSFKVGTRNPSVV